jgi:hypothetical protein
VVVVDSKQFLDNFPYLKSIGINTIQQVKEKLVLKGKINSEFSEKWIGIGISYNYYSVSELKLTIRYLDNEYKVKYREVTQEFKGGKLPLINPREDQSISNFRLTVKKQPIEVIQKTDSVTIFQLRKAS